MKYYDVALQFEVEGNNEEDATMAAIETIRRIIDEPDALAAVLDVWPAVSEDDDDDEEGYYEEDFEDEEEDD